MSDRPRGLFGIAPQPLPRSGLLGLLADQMAPPALTSFGASPASAMLPTPFLGGGAVPENLTSYTPTPRERMAGLLSDAMGGGRQAYDRGEKIATALDFTPLGIPSAAYDAGRETAGGNYGMGLLAAMGAVPAAKPAASAVGGLGDAFSKWFGKSHVVNKDGSPLVVYKSMYPYDWTKETKTDAGPLIESINRTQDFPAFNRGEPGVKIAGFFGDKDTANKFSQALGDRQAIYPTYLSFQKPYVIDAKGGKAGAFQFGESGKPFREAIRSGEYDSVIIRNTADEGDIYVALKPEQIKSTFNKGTFDPKDPRILYGGAAGLLGAGAYKAGDDDN